MSIHRLHANSESDSAHLSSSDAHFSLSMIAWQNKSPSSGPAITDTATFSNNTASRRNHSKKAPSFCHLSLFHTERQGKKDRRSSLPVHLRTISARTPDAQVSRTFFAKSHLHRLPERCLIVQTAAGSLADLMMPFEQEKSAVFDEN